MYLGLRNLLWFLLGQNKEGLVGNKYVATILSSCSTIQPSSLLHNIQWMMSLNTEVSQHHWYTTSLHTRYRLVGKSTPHFGVLCGDSGRSSGASLKESEQWKQGCIFYKLAHFLPQPDLSHNALKAQTKLKCTCLTHTLNDSALLLPLSPHNPPSEDFNTPELTKRMLKKT